MVIRTARSQCVPIGEPSTREQILGQGRPSRRRRGGPGPRATPTGASPHTRRATASTKGLFPDRTGGETRIGRRTGTSGAVWDTDTMAGPKRDEPAEGQARRRGPSADERAAASGPQPTPRPSELPPLKAPPAAPSDAGPAAVATAPRRGGSALPPLKPPPEPPPAEAPPQR